MSDSLQINEMGNNKNQWKDFYVLAAVTTTFALAGILLDVLIGMITGGNLSALPQTAIERFAEFQENKWIGMYHLDLLNSINQMILIPAYIALYAAHQHSNRAYGFLALTVFLFGSVIMVANNTALPMFELSSNYATATTESQKALYAAAGESMLAMGAHGSSGIFLGFFIPNIANLMMSVVMLRGNVFSKINAWIGIVGSILMLFYIVLVNFGSSIAHMATAFAMPGGLLLMTWMILYTIKLFQLGRYRSIDIGKNKLL